MKFDIVGEIEQAETIASGRGVRARAIGRRDFKIKAYVDEL